MTENKAWNERAGNLIYYTHSKGDAKRCQMTFLTGLRTMYLDNGLGMRTMQIKGYFTSSIVLKSLRPKS